MRSFSAITSKPSSLAGPLRWLLVTLATCSWAHVAFAQTGAGGSGTSGGAGAATGGGTTTSPTGGAGTGSGTGTGVKTGTGTGTGTTTGSGTGTGGATSTITPPTTPTTPATGTGGGSGGTTPANPFGFNDPPPPTGSTLPFGSGAAGTLPGGATTTFGAGTQRTTTGTGTTTESTEPAATTKIKPPEQTFSTPGLYGQGRQNFVAGQGRFAKPRYRYTVSLGMGFDDNTLQTPTNQESREEQTIRTVVAPAQPAITQNVPVREFAGFEKNVNNAGFHPVYRTVNRTVTIRPAIPEQVVTTVVPGFTPEPPNSSVISTLDLSANVQWLKSRSAFTFDLNAGADYYWNRDTSPLDYHASMSLAYAYKFSPRMQGTANVSYSHQTQPDYSQVNLVANSGSGGAHDSLNAKVDLSYRWAPRISTVTSLGASGILYSGRPSSNYTELIIGNELRYVLSRRFTWILEGRYSLIHYLESLVGNSSTIFALLGVDWVWNSRIHGSLRAGESARTFESGGKASSPYAELSTSYRLSRRSQFSLTGRYGFELSQQPGSETLTTRFSGSYSYAFSPRLSGSFSGNYVLSEPQGGGGNTNVLDGTMGLNYRYSRKFSLSARYSYTLSKTDLGISDYDKNRFFLTGTYEF